jgi:hypothetical protein
MFQSYDQHEAKYINGQGFSTDNGSIVYNVVDIVIVLYI